MLLYCFSLGPPAGAGRAEEDELLAFALVAAGGGVGGGVAVGVVVGIGGGVVGFDPPDGVYRWTRRGGVLLIKSLLASSTCPK